MSRLKISLLIIFGLLLSVFNVSTALAVITVTPTPNPVQINQAASVAIQSVYVGTGSTCTLNVNYGDGNTQSGVALGACTTSGSTAVVTTCNQTLTHTYTSPGTYTINVTTPTSCAPSPGALGTGSITVTCTAPALTSPSTLTTGTVNQGYSYSLTGTGSAPLSYSLYTGSPPPGLTLSSTGFISGTPTTAGTYSFDVRLQNNTNCGQFVVSTFSITINPATTPTSISVSPSSMGISTGATTPGTFNYRFSGTGNTTLTSSSGVIYGGGRLPLYTNSVPLSMSVVNGQGQVSESITIPPSVAEQALRSGQNRITYERSFTNGNINITSSAPIYITSGAGAGPISSTDASGNLDIKRMEMYFIGNNSGVTTVPRNFKGLKAGVAISYNGFGQLQGYWEVDGRIIERVFQLIQYGGQIKLELPPYVDLPTYDPGNHVVRFVVESPATPFQTPMLFYFVTPGESFSAIKGTMPPNDAIIPFAPTRFEWERGSDAKIYLILFRKKADDDKQVFSAYTSNPSYILQDIALKKFFMPGQSYTWKVKALDAKGSTTSESPFINFTFQKSATHVPGQILVVLAENDAIGASEEIGKLNGLKIIEKSSLSTLGYLMTLFDAGKEDIFSTIDKIRKDKRVVFVQPNYLFNSSGEDSLRKVQKSADLMNKDRLHKYAKGTGIRVAIIDTGVDVDHADLKKQIVFKQNFVRGESYQAELHGTAVAGLIAANGKEFNGIAPASEIIALRACRQVSKGAPEGVCTTDSLAKAFDVAISKKAHIINMSFGSMVRDDILERLIATSIDDGILVVAPVGNRADSTGLQFPASHPGVIAVGGIDEQNNPWPNATIAGKAAVSAPAVNVLTTIPGDRHNFLTGTSLSSATVSGLLALAIERDKGMTRVKVPTFNNDICKWEEQLLKISVCDKKK